jgi:putative transposase
VSRFRFIDAEKVSHPVALSCRLLRVSRAGFYAWRSRPPSCRSVADADLTRTIRGVHAGSRGTYGAPRVRAELADAHGVRCGGKRVARLMRLAGLAGCHRRRRSRTTRRDEAAAPAPDLVRRAFIAAEPDRLWVADTTYLPTWPGFLYLAVVLDAWSRRVVGWSMADTLRSGLVVDALEMALHNRRPPVGVVHHSDRGSQYTSLAFGQRCRRAGVVPSMGSVGDAYDNALAESFFATLGCELVRRRRWRSHAEARTAVFDFVEGFYNTRRRYSALGYLSPADFEARRRPPQTDVA